MTCTGQLYLCLGQDDNADLALALRSGGKEGLKSAIIEAISRKPLGHDFAIERGLSNQAVSRHMSVTGG
jgi:cyclic pyranopterin phosphate synthase